MRRPIRHMSHVKKWVLFMRLATALLTLARRCKNLIKD
jgi:hypothetical protein